MSRSEENQKNDQESQTTAPKLKYNDVEKNIRDLNKEISRLKKEKAQLREQVDQRLLAVLQQSHQFVLNLPFDIFTQANPLLGGNGYNISVPEELSDWGYIPDAYRLIVVPKSNDHYGRGGPYGDQTHIKIESFTQTLGYNEHLEPYGKIKIEFVPEGYYNYSQQPHGQWNPYLLFGERLSSVAAMRLASRSTVETSDPNGTHCEIYGYQYYDEGHSENRFYNVPKVAASWLHPIEYASMILTHMSQSIEKDGRQHAPTVAQLARK